MTVTLEQVAARDNLERAWIKAKFYAQSFDVYYDVQRYHQFEHHLTANLRVLRSRLLDGYQPEPLLGLRLPRPGGHRDLYMLSMWDNVASLAFLNLLAPPVEDIIRARSSDLSFGNRFDLTDTSRVLLDWRDQHGSFSQALRDIAALPDDHWYMRSDISNYYPSIHVERVLGLLAPLVNRGVYELISAFLSLSGRVGNDQRVQIDGLPIGPAYSHLFANLYLADFDAWIKSRAVRYVRYVDDFFYASSTEEELLYHFHEVERRLSEIGLSTHPHKTERYPVTDTVCIESTITRLKYNIRMETPELKAAGLAEVAEALLYEAFIDSELFRDPKATAFVAWRLTDLGYSDIDSLSEVVCDVLETGALKSSEIRRLVTFLIDKNQDRLPDRFIQYLASTDDAATRLITLDVFDDSPACARKSAVHILESFLASESFLVRAYTYATLGSSLVDRASLDSLIQRCSEESSCFVKAQQVALIIGSHPGEIAMELAYWMRQSSEVKLAILSSASVLDSRVVTRALVPALNLLDIDATHFSPYIYLLMLHSMKSRLDDFIKMQEIIRTETDLSESLAALAHEAFDELIQQQAHFACYELLSIMREIDPNLTVQSIDRLRREAQSGSTATADRFAALLNEALPVAADEATVWSLESDAGLKKVFLGRYVVERELISLKPLGNALYEVVCKDTGTRGALELLPIAKLKSRGLSGGDFLQILTALSAEDVCGQVYHDHIQLGPGTGYVWVFYPYPESFVPLSEVIKSQRGDGRIADRVQVMTQIISRICRSGHSSRFQSVHAHSVLANPALDVRLSAIGTSIVDSTYLFTLGSDSWQEGLGLSNLSFCFGLLLYEYLSGESPYRYLQPTKRKQHMLHDEALENLAPNRADLHIRYLFARGTARQPENRYNNMRTFKEDLERIGQYLCRLEELPLTNPKSEFWLLEIADYAAFRCEVILRSPRMNDLEYGVLECREYAYHQLAHEFIELLPRLGLTASEVADLGRKWIRTPQSVRYSSPAAQQLVKLAEFLGGVIEEANLQFDTDYRLQLPIIVLIRALDFEFTVLVYSLAVGSTLGDSDLQEYAAAVRSWLDSGNITDGWVSPPMPARQKVALQIDAARIKRLGKIIAELSTPMKALRHIEDLVDAIIFVILHSSGLSLHLDDKRYLSSKLSTTRSHKASQVLRLAFLASALEEDLHQLVHSYGTVNPSRLCEDRIWPAFRLLRRLRPAKRLKGKLVDYARESQQGSFEWNPLPFRRRTWQWQRRDVLHLGLEPSKVSKMPATMDVSDYNQDILSVINPISRSPLLPLDSWWRRVWNWYRAHPWIVTIGLVLLVLSVAMLIASGIPYGVAGLVINLLFVLLGLKIDDLREMISRELNPEYAD